MRCSHGKNAMFQLTHRILSVESSQCFLLLRSPPNICTIDYQIFAINTVEKSCGFNHGEIKNKELTFSTLSYSVSNSKIVLDAIMLPNGVSIFQVKLGTIRINKS